MRERIGCVGIFEAATLLKADCAVKEGECVFSSSVMDEL